MARTKTSNEASSKQDEGSSTTSSTQNVNKEPENKGTVDLKDKEKNQLENSSDTVSMAVDKKKRKTPDDAEQLQEKPKKATDPKQKRQRTEEKGKEPVPQTEESGGSSLKKLNAQELMAKVVQMGSSEMDPVEFRKFLDMMENVKQQTEQNDKPADIHSAIDRETNNWNGGGAIWTEEEWRVLNTWAQHHDSYHGYDMENIDKYLAFVRKDDLHMWKNYPSLWKSVPASGDYITGPGEYDRSEIPVVGDVPTQDEFMNNSELWSPAKCFRISLLLKHLWEKVMCDSALPSPSAFLTYFNLLRLLPNFWFDPHVVEKYGTGFIRFNQTVLSDVKTPKGVREDLSVLERAGLVKVNVPGGGNKKITAYAIRLSFDTKFVTEKDTIYVGVQPRCIKHSKKRSEGKKSKSEVGTDNSNQQQQLNIRDPKKTVASPHKSAAVTAETATSLASEGQVTVEGVKKIQPDIKTADSRKESPVLKPPSPRLTRSQTKRASKKTEDEDFVPEDSEESEDDGEGDASKEKEEEEEEEEEEKAEVGEAQSTGKSETEAKEKRKKQPKKGKGKEQTTKGKGKGNRGKKNSK